MEPGQNHMEQTVAGFDGCRYGAKDRLQCFPDSEIAQTTFWLDDKITDQAYFV
jgi:hypothetical protein